MFYKIIEPIEEGVPIQYLGVYILKWGKVTDPEVGFVEADDDEIIEYLEKQGHKVIKGEYPPASKETMNDGN